MRRSLGPLVALLLLVKCASTHLDVDSPDYRPCGSTICVHGWAAKVFVSPAQALVFGGDDTVERRVALKGVVAKDFRVLHGPWATDGRHMWCGLPEPAAPAAGFRVLGEGFYAAGGRVWQGCYPVFTGDPLKRETRVVVAPDAFAALGCGIVRVKQTLYHPTGGGYHFGREPFAERRLEPLQLVDHATFRMEANCRGRDAKFAYVIENGALARVDPASSGSAATALPCGYARVEDRVYYKGKLIPGADAATFQVLTPDRCSWVYARDARRLYRYLMPIEGIDGKSVELVTTQGSTLVFRDRHGLIVNERRIHTVADPPTFEPIVPASPCRIVSQSYARDSVHIYYGLGPLEGADPKTFRIIEPQRNERGECARTGAYARDAQHVWFERQRIAGADPETFVVDSSGVSARDRNHFYLRANLDD